MPYTDFGVGIIDKTDRFWLGRDLFSDGGYIILKDDSASYFNKNNSNYPGKLLNSIIEDEQGIKWCVVDSEFYKYDEKTWQKINLPSGMSIELVSIAGRDKLGNIWIKSGDSKTLQLARYDGSQWKIIPNPKNYSGNYFGEIAFDKNGVGWMTTGMGHIIKIHNDSMQIVDKMIITTIQNTNTIIDTFSTYSNLIISDKMGNIWLGGDGLSMYDGSEWKHHFTTSNSLLPNHHLQSLAFDKNGSLWVGTYGGIAKYSPSIDTWTNYKSPLYGNNGYQDCTNGILINSKNEKFFFLSGWEGFIKLENE